MKLLFGDLKGKLRSDDALIVDIVKMTHMYIVFAYYMYTHLNVIAFKCNRVHIVAIFTNGAIHGIHFNSHFI